ncbi:hypothetical protein E2C01_067363 [Portunus trituberculatus]|uniref:Uncharacterized protein n=1 Tax=Portunus trituberculatus TaxID=210409 RepID=A0A5B7HUU3_PORTR|nr:hypothetical protein [Portunus trituberculatus]
MDGFSGRHVEEREEKIEEEKGKGERGNKTRLASPPGWIRRRPVSFSEPLLRSLRPLLSPSLPALHRSFSTYFLNLVLPSSPPAGKPEPGSSCCAFPRTTTTFPLLPSSSPPVFPLALATSALMGSDRDGRPRHSVLPFQARVSAVKGEGQSSSDGKIAANYSNFDDYFLSPLPPSRRWRGGRTGEAWSAADLARNGHEGART